MRGEEKRVQPEQSATGPQRPERGRGRRDRGREGRDSEYNEKAPRSIQRGRDERGTENSDVLSQARDARLSVPSAANRKPQGERSAQKKQPRPPREEKIRTENKLLTGEEQPAMKTLLSKVRMADAAAAVVEDSVNGANAQTHAA